MKKKQALNRKHNTITLQDGEEDKQQGVNESELNIAELEIIHKDQKWRKLINKKNHKTSRPNQCIYCWNWRCL